MSEKTSGQIIREARKKAGTDSAKFYSTVREMSKPKTKTKSSSSSRSRSSSKTSGQIIREARKTAGDDPKKFYKEVARLSGGGTRQATTTITTRDKPAVTTAEKLVDKNPTVQREGREELSRLSQNQRQATINYATELTKRIKNVRSTFTTGLSDKERLNLAKKEINKIANQLTGRETSGQLIRTSRELAERYNLDPNKVNNILSEHSKQVKDVKTVTSAINQLTGRETSGQLVRMSRELAKKTGLKQSDILKEITTQSIDVKIKSKKALTDLKNTTKKLTGRETAGDLVKLSRELAKKHNLEQTSILKYLSEVARSKTIDEKTILKEVQKDLNKLKVDNVQQSLKDLNNLLKKYEERYNIDTSDIKNLALKHLRQKQDFKKEQQKLINKFLNTFTEINLGDLIALPVFKHYEKKYNILNNIKTVFKTLTKKQQDPKDLVKLSQTLNEIKKSTNKKIINRINQVTEIKQNLKKGKVDTKKIINVFNIPKGKKFSKIMEEDLLKRYNTKIESLKPKIRLIEDQIQKDTEKSMISAKSNLNKLTKERTALQQLYDLTVKKIKEKTKSIIDKNLQNTKLKEAIYQTLGLTSKPTRKKVLNAIYYQFQSELNRLTKDMLKGLEEYDKDIKKLESKWKEKTKESPLSGEKQLQAMTIAGSQYIIGFMRGSIGALNVALHPVETIKIIPKALYRLPETVVLLGKQFILNPAGVMGEFTAYSKAFKIAGKGGSNLASYIKQATFIRTLPLKLQSMLSKALSKSFKVKKPKNFGIFELQKLSKSELNLLKKVIKKEKGVIFSRKVAGKNRLFVGINDISKFNKNVAKTFNTKLGRGYRVTGNRVTKSNRALYYGVDLNYLVTSPSTKLFLKSKTARKLLRKSAKDLPKPKPFSMSRIKKQLDRARIRTESGLTKSQIEAQRRLDRKMLSALKKGKMPKATRVEGVTFNNVYYDGVNVYKSNKLTQFSKSNLAQAGAKFYKQIKLYPFKSSKTGLRYFSSRKQWLKAVKQQAKATPVKPVDMTKTYTLFDEQAKKYVNPTKQYKIISKAGKIQILDNKGKSLFSVDLPKPKPKKPPIGTTTTKTIQVPVGNQIMLQKVKVKTKSPQVQAIAQAIAKQIPKVKTKSGIVKIRQKISKVKTQQAQVLQKVKTQVLTKVKTMPLLQKALTLRGVFSALLILNRGLIAQVKTLQKVKIRQKEAIAQVKTLQKQAQVIKELVLESAILTDVLQKTKTLQKVKLTQIQLQKLKIKRKQIEKLKRLIPEKEKDDLEKKLQKEILRKATKENFIYLPDLFSKVIGIKATIKEKKKLLKPRKIFTGLEQRKLIA